jgi:hypothetical protein
MGAHIVVKLRKYVVITVCPRYGVRYTRFALHRKSEEVDAEFLISIALRTLFNDPRNGCTDIFSRASMGVSAFASSLRKMRESIFRREAFCRAADMNSASKSLAERLTIVSDRVIKFKGFARFHIMWDLQSLSHAAWNVFLIFPPCLDATSLYMLKREPTARALSHCA